MEFKIDKAFWRNARLLLWSFIVAFAALDLFNLVKPPAEIAALMFLVYVAAAWVIAYHALQKLRGS